MLPAAYSPFRSFANGSVTSIAKIFQSVSPETNRLDKRI